MSQQIVEQRIAEWISDGDVTAWLNLKNLGLTEFPPVHSGQGPIAMHSGQGPVAMATRGLPSSLQRLNLSNNQICKIPHALPSGLQYLHLHNNQIREIPDTLPPGLCMLCIDNNQIREIPSTLPLSLWWLYLNNNQISEIPDTLPSGLQILSLDDNPVADKLSLAPKDDSETWSSYACRLAEERAVARAATRCSVIRDELCYVVKK